MATWRVLMLCIADNADTACCEQTVSFVSQMLSGSVALRLTSSVYYRHTSVCNFAFRYRKVLILQLHYNFIRRCTVEQPQKLKINYCRSQMYRVFKFLQNRYVQTLLVSAIKKHANYLYGSHPVMITTK